MNFKIPESLSVLFRYKIIQVQVTVFPCEVKNTSQVLFQLWKCKQMEHILRMTEVHKLRAQYWVVKIIETFLAWAGPIAQNSLLHAEKLILSFWLLDAG